MPRQTVPFGTWFQLIATLFLLVITVHSNDPVPVPTREVYPHSWLQISNGQWPTSDDLYHKKNKDPFYIYHGESRKSPFGLNQNAINWETIVGKPELLFRYWASDDIERLRPERSKDKGFPLEHARQWTDAKTVIKDKDTWNNMRVLGGDEFYTLALKDIKVRYQEQFTGPNLPQSPIHGYAPHSSLDISEQTTPINILCISSKQAKIQIVDEIMIKSPGQNLLSFQFVAYPNGTVQTVQLKSNKEQNGCDVADLPDATFQCEVDPKSKQIQSLLVTLKDKESAAILNPNLGSINIAEKTIEVYTKSQVSFLDSQPDNSDVCYTIDIPENSPEIQVYLTPKDATSGIKLDTFRGKSSTFCINNYIALRRLKNYQLTLLIQGRIAQNFQLTRSINNKEFKVKKPNESKTTKLTKGWYFFSPNLNYTIRGPIGIDKDIIFHVCDVTANCFRYERDVDPDNKIKTIYTIRPDHLELLKESPFVRIMSSHAITTPEYYDFAYAKSAEHVMSTIEAQLQEGHEVPFDHTKSVQRSPGQISYRQKLAKKTGIYKLEIPLDSLDQRIHALEITIQSVEPKDANLELQRVQLFKKPNSYTPDMSHLFAMRNGQQNRIFISTEEMFHMESFRPGGSISGSLVIILNVPEHSKTDTILTDITIKVVEDQIDPQTSGVDYTILPMNLPKTKSNYSILDSKNPKAYITTGLIRSTFDRSLPPYSLNLRFIFEISQKIDPKDISITQWVLHQGVMVDNSKVLQPEIKMTPNKTTEARFVYHFNLPGKIPIGDNSYQLIFEITLKNVKQNISIDVEHFELQDPSQTKSPLSTESGPLIATLDPRYDPFACPANFKDNKANICQLDQLFQERTIECQGSPLEGCPNIFSPPLLTSHQYYSSRHPTHYSPYQINPKTDPTSSYLEVTIPKLDPPQDYCINFRYLASDSLLQITSNLKSQYAIEFQTNTKVEPTKVCTSWFSNQVETITSLYFRFAKFPIVDIDNHYVEIDQPEVHPVNNALIKGSGSGEKSWEANFMYKPEYFDLSKPGEIEFKIPNLQTLKPKQQQLVTYLRTKWIRAIPTRKDQFRLSLTPSGDYQKEFYKISLIVFSPQGPLAAQDLKDLSSSSPQLVTLNLTSNPTDIYQLTLKFELDLDKTTDEKETSVKLTGITINDPCIDNNNQLKPCNHGHCQGDYDSFSSSCKCDDGFGGSDCTEINYCSTKINGVKNSDKCKGLTCINLPKLATFACACKGNETWNGLTQSCIKSLPKCGDNEMLQFKNGNPECACIDGYIRLKPAEACIQYDVCNVEHRKVNKEKLTKPCSDPNANCISKEPNKYECTCDKEFYNEFGIHNSNAKCLPELCKSCEQLCSPKHTINGTIYECDCIHGKYTKDANGHCQPVKDIDTSPCTSNQPPPPGYPLPFIKSTSPIVCSCPNGFKFDQQTKSCLVDETKFGCKKAILRPEDSQPGCACADGQQFDPITRKCLMECTDDKTKECDQIQADCQIVQETAQCTCKPGLIEFSEDNKPESFKCINPCELVDKPEFVEGKCTGKFQRCNPSKMTFTNRVNGTIVPGTSKIDPQSKHCECDVGFQLDKTGKCELSTTPVRYIKDMEFDLRSGLNSEAEKQAFVQETIQPAFIWLIESTFDTETIDKETSCEAKENTILCSAGFKTNLTREAIQGKLHDQCVFTDEAKSKCTYMTEEQQAPRNKRSVEDEWYAGHRTGSKRLMSYLNRQVKPVKVESINYCVRSPNLCRAFFQNSYCKPKPIDDELYFECLCNSTLFSVLSVRPEPSPKGDLQMESCQLKDLCTEYKDDYGCADPEAICNQMVDYKNGQYVPQSFCSCPKTKTVLPNRNQYCTNPCDTGYCGNGTCAVDLYNPKTVLCKCNEGYTGERCDKKIEAKSVEDTSGVSSGYKTATIVLAVFFSLGLVALGFVLVKRYTGFNVVMYVSELVNQRRNRAQPQAPNPQPRQNIPLERQRPANQ